MANSAQRLRLTFLLFKFHDASYWNDNLVLKVVRLGSGCRVQHFDISKRNEAAREVNPYKDNDTLMRLRAEMTDFAIYLMEINTYEV